MGEALDRGASFDEARRIGQSAAKEAVLADPVTYGPQFARFENPHVLDWAGDWGSTLSENVLGVAGYKSAEGYGVNRELLDAIAQGETPSQAVLNSIPEAQLPINVKGRVLEPDTAGTLERVANMGWKRFLGPIINKMSREPAFSAEWSRQYNYLLDHGFEEGQAAVVANQRAAENMLQFVHNPQERSQLGYTVRNLMPFYFAQEQAYRRAGRLLATDPAAFRRYQLMLTGFNNIATKTSDPNGTNYMMMPGTGFLTQPTVAAMHLLFPGRVSGAVSSALSGNLTSMSTVFPLTEGALPWQKLGPVVSIPLHSLELLRPETAPAITSVVGQQATAGSLWDQLIPNTFIKNVLAAANLRGETTSQHNSTISILQLLADQGKVPQPDAAPMVKQTFVDRVKNQSRVLDIVKAMFSLVSPSAPQVVINNKFSDLFQTYLKKYPNNYTQAATEFLKDYPDATAQTVARSSTTLKGLPATKEAEDWVNSHPDIVQNYPMAAAYLIPQTGKYDAVVYNEQLAQHLRQRIGDAPYLDALYKASADAQFYNRDMVAHDAEIARLKAAGDTAGVTAENANFQAYIAQVFGPQNPVWYADFGTQASTKLKQQAISQLIELASKGPIDSPMAEGVIGLLTDFAAHQAALQPSQFEKLTGQAKIDEENNWQAYLRQVADQNPQLRVVINALFRDPGEAAIQAAQTQAAA
jgi:hypothetical protein